MKDDNGYSAFISYRHAPLDSKVATHVQHHLEHMHIPGPVRRATGKKEVGRVFRDKEELPITVDIAGSIQGALDEAEFLIVICSPRTRESSWVQREISYFLSKHDISHVLTVLAEGEPDDVIPEILRQDLEPLSCDYRLGFRTAQKVELPRLAAAILGCRYDDLMQRQKQYRRRIILSVGIAVLTFFTLFVSYLIWSNIQIRSRYEEAMRSRSKYLARESAALFNGGNRILALQLAVEALPQNEKDQALFPELFRLFDVATYAYSDPIDNYNMTETARFHTDDNIQDFIMSPDGRYAVTIGDQMVLSIFDLEKNEKIRSSRLQDETGKDYTRYLVSLNSFGNDAFLVYVSNQPLLSCISYSDGSVLWEKKYESGIWDLVTTAGETEPSAVFMLTDEQKIRVIDPSGTDKTIVLDNIGGRAFEVSKFQFWHGMAAISEDGNRCAFFVDRRPGAGSDENSSGILTWDRKQENFWYAELPDDSVVSENPVFDRNGNIVIAMQKDAEPQDPDDLLSLSGMSANEYSDYVLCLDPESGKELWRTYLDDVYLAGVFESLSGFHMISADIGSDEEQVSCIILYYNQIMIILDAADGKILCATNSVYKGKIADITVDGGMLRCLCTDGTSMRYLTVEDIAEQDKNPMPNSPTMFAESVSAARHYDMVVDGNRRDYDRMITACDNCLSIYGYPQGDNDYMPVPEDDGFQTDDDRLDDTRNCWSKGDRLFIIDKNNRLAYIDMKDNVCRYRVPVKDSDEYTDYTMLGMTGDGKKLFFYVKRDHTLYELSIETGAIRTREFEHDYYNNSFFMYDDKLYFIGAGDEFDTSAIYIYDPETETETTAEIPEAPGYDFYSWFIADNANGRMYYLDRGKHRLMSLDLKTFESGTVEGIDLSGNIEYWRYAVDDSSGTIILSLDPECFYILDENTGSTRRIETVMYEKTCFTLFEDQVFAVDKDNTVYRYSLKSGEYLGRIDDLPKMGENKRLSIIRTADDVIVLGISRDYDWVYALIDTRWWKVRNRLNADAFDPESRLFYKNITIDKKTDAHRIVTYPIYSLGDLADKARAILEGMEMSESEKEQYGLAY